MKNFTYHLKDFDENFMNSTKNARSILRVISDRILEFPDKANFERNRTETIDGLWADKMKISTIHGIELLLLDLNKWNETGKMTSNDLQSSIQNLTLQLSQVNSTKIDFSFDSENFLGSSFMKNLTEEFSILNDCAETNETRIIDMFDILTDAKETFETLKNNSNFFFDKTRSDRRNIRLL